MALDVIVVRPNEVKYASGRQRLDVVGSRKNFVVVYSRRERVEYPFGDADALMLNYAGRDNNDEMRTAVKRFIMELGHRERGAKAFDECYIAYYAMNYSKNHSGIITRFRDLVATILETNPDMYRHNSVKLKFWVNRCDFGSRK